MPSPLDFNAELSSQLRKAAESMKAMRAPRAQQDDASTPSVHEVDTPPVPQEQTVAMDDSCITEQQRHHTVNKKRGTPHSHTCPKGGRQHTKPLPADAPAMQSPLLSPSSWTGGTKGAVLAHLRELAQGGANVCVNLKRLALSMGLPYGSVRNTVSRLVRTGDITSQQVHLADGHGVRITFLTQPGEEGTGVPPQAKSHTLSALQQPVPVFSSVQSSQYPAIVQEVSALAAPEQNAFWNTRQDIFERAWPFVAQTGITMHDIKSLEDVFAAQGFDVQNLPRSLRALDIELEKLPQEQRATYAQTFIATLQRSGVWTAIS